MTTQMQDYDIVGSYNNQRVTSIDAERTVNLFEYRDPLGKKRRSLISTSGIKNSNITFGNSSGGIRAEFIFNQFHYVVVGTDVYIVNENNAASKINSMPLATEQGYVGIEANNAVHPQIIFVDGIFGYIYDTVASTWQIITDTAFPELPIDVTYLDGFFIVADGGSNQFQLSMLNNGLIWGVAQNTITNVIGTDATTLIVAGGTDNYQTSVPFQFLLDGGTLPTVASGPALTTTDFYYAIYVDSTHIRVARTLLDAYNNVYVTFTSNATPTVSIKSLGQLQVGLITSHPGNIVACRTLHRRLFLFSQNYAEVWENAGAGTNLPFRRNNAYLIESGTPTASAVITGFDKLFYLSQDKNGCGSIMQIDGVQPIPISNKALDYQISQYAFRKQLADVSSILIKENGIIFYRINFTAANHTYVYNVSMSNPGSEPDKLWHEELMLNGDRHVAQTHGYFNGSNYYGHFSQPILYNVSQSFYTNDGEAIKRMRIGKPVVNSGYERRRIDRFHLDVQQGNISQLGITFEPLDLLTEDGYVLLTEGELDIYLEQELLTSNPITPYVYFSTSKDSGQTFGTIVKSAMGKVGERSFRTVWRKLHVVPRGQAFVPKFEFYDAVPLIILGAAWATEVLPE